MTKPEITLTKDHLAHINSTLSGLTPQQILQWAVWTFPHLYQTTAFGLTGLATIDMLSKLDVSVELIFIDTLHHFPQTLELVDRVKAQYGVNVHVFRPKDVTTEPEFAAKHGDSLWDTNDQLYDYLVKVEPAQRGYRELGVAAVLTGRRRTQGGARGELPVIEIEAESGVIKINPLADWSFPQVHEYVKQNGVPYNELLDLGYKSIGDYHSTNPIKEGEDERSGRWQGKAKTECGIHETSKFAEYLRGGSV